jgi:heme/copper-type cytochrome/quinol oxidase subunit 1
VAGLVVLAGLTAASAAALGRTGAMPTPGDRASYYVVTHVHLLVLAALGSALFAGVYRALEALRRGRHRRTLGAWHFGLTFVGVNLIFLPQHLTVLTPGLAAATSGGRAFALLQGIAMSGYVLALAGLAFFAAVLLDALRREADLG